MRENISTRRAARSMIRATMSSGAIEDMMSQSNIFSLECLYDVHSQVRVDSSRVKPTGIQASPIYARSR